MCPSPGSEGVLDEGILDSWQPCCVIFTVTTQGDLRRKQLCICEVSLVFIHIACRVRA